MRGLADRIHKINLLKLHFVTKSSLKTSLTEQYNIGMFFCMNNKHVMQTVAFLNNELFLGRTLL